MSALISARWRSWFFPWRRAGRSLGRRRLRGRWSCGRPHGTRLRRLFLAFLRRGRRGIGLRASGRTGPCHDRDRLERLRSAMGSFRLCFRRWRMGRLGRLSSGFGDGLRLDHPRRGCFCYRRATAFAEFSVEVQRAMAESAVDPAARGRYPPWVVVCRCLFKVMTRPFLVKTRIRRGFAYVRPASETKARPVRQLRIATWAEGHSLRIRAGR